MEADAYSKAGVNIEAGNTAVQEIKAAVQATYTPQVLSGLGNFGAAVELPAGFRQPVLISGTDGVGTKLLLAIAANRHETIGQDLVAMVMNDIVAEGAQPLFLQDYLAVDHIRPEVVKTIVTGIAQATQAVGAALVGGEMAELPGLYAAHHYDLAAFGVGIAEKDQLLNSVAHAQAGDLLLGLPSSGLHSNGYSLVRSVLGLKEATDFQQLTPELQTALLTPTTLYYPLVQDLLAQHLLVGMSHITGGGIVGNLPRSFSHDLQAVIQTNGWQIPAIFKLLKQKGQLTTADMLTTFNNGVGMILMVKPANLPTVLQHFATLQQPIYQLGYLQAKPQTAADAVVFTGEFSW